MKTLNYTASLDTLAKIITGFVFLLFIIIGQDSVRNILLYDGHDWKSLLTHSGLLLLLIGILLGSYLFSPKKYEIQNDQLVIKRSIGDVVISADQITEIQKLDENNKRGIRTFGVGGLFGYFGRFRLSGLGPVTCYITQKKNMILVRTKAGKKIIISPDDISLADKLEEIKG